MFSTTLNDSQLAQLDALIAKFDRMAERRAKSEKIKADNLKYWEEHPEQFYSECDPDFLTDDDADAVYAAFMKEDDEFIL